MSSRAAIEALDHPLILAGEPHETGEWAEVPSPYDGEPVGRVAIGDAALVDRAVRAAHAAFEAGGFPQYERAAVLDRGAALVEERREELALTIALEAGKPIRTARVEAERCAQTLRFSAVEARRLSGGTVPMEASAAGQGKLGVMLRVPYGVVGAISPFNFPLNLVAHKLGPAIAAGNAVVLKPAHQTPISALRLAAILLEAGLPQAWLSVIPGPGRSVGNAIVEHPLTAAITFTGSAPVGWGIRSAVPHKKVSLELGSNAPLIVNEDGDWETAADKAKIHAFSHAGQSCISIQRILVHERVADAFSERLLADVESLVVGDPLSEATDVGPLITPGDRDRVKGWIEEAVAAGAKLLSGGELPTRAAAWLRRSSPPRPKTPRSGARRSSARSPRSTPSPTSSRRSRWRTTPSSGCRRESSPAISAAPCRPPAPWSSAACWSTRCRPSAPTSSPTAGSRNRATPARAPPTRWRS
jgi:acyl-CoA reductase-like NAD-dependent aldehyde dehydrogenase